MVTRAMLLGVDPNVEINLLRRIISRRNWSRYALFVLWSPMGIYHTARSNFPAIKGFLIQCNPGRSRSVPHDRTQPTPMKNFPDDRSIIEIGNSLQVGQVTKSVLCVGKFPIYKCPDDILPLLRNIRSTRPSHRWRIQSAPIAAWRSLVFHLFATFSATTT